MALRDSRLVSLLGFLLSLVLVIRSLPKDQSTSRPHGKRSSLIKNEPPTNSFPDYMLRSQRGVLSLLVLDWITAKRRTRDIESLRVAPALAFALLPGLLNGVLLLFGGETCDFKATSWLTYYSALIFTLFLFPQIAWRGLMRASRPVNDMLILEEDSARLTRAIRRQLNLPLQAIISLVCGVGALAGLWILQAELEGVVDICPASYLTVFITGALGVNAVYWLWTVPLFVAQLSKINTLRVYQHAPAHTPGIRKLSKLLAFSAMLAGFGVVIFEVPIFYAIERLGSKGFLGKIYIGGLVVSILTFLFVAVFPQILLSTVGLREKWRLLDRLSQQITFKADLTSPQGAETILRYVELYRKLETAPGGTVERETLFRFGLAFLTLFFPYIVKWLT